LYTNQAAFLGISGENGDLFAFLTKEAVNTKEISVSYRNLKYLEGVKVYKLEGQTQI